MKMAPIQVLTLCFCAQWLIGPVDFKRYWSPKKVPGANKNNKLIKKNHNFCNTSHYKSKDASLAIISFVVGDLLLCFLGVFYVADNVAAGIV